MKKILIVVDSDYRKFNLFNKIDDITVVMKRSNKLEEIIDNNIFESDLIVLDDDLVRTKKFKKLKKFLNIKGKNFILSSYFKLDNKEQLVDQLRVLLEKRKFKNKHLVIIGSSTGGPKALQEIISKLPNKLNSIILIVQHMPAQFTESLAKRLDSMSAISVKEVEDGELLEQGKIYLAQGDKHFKIEKKYNRLYAKLSYEEKHLGLRPAVDILLKSIYELNDYKRMSVILTGMGTDGTLGLKGLDSYNIVQDKESSVIYGMPNSALKSNVVDKVVPLQDIAFEIIKRVGC